MDYDGSTCIAADIAAPAGGAALPARWESRARWRLGMPQLDACGLSEHWLQKTCGDRHWQALARLCGRAPQHWLDAHGRRAYAAFAYLRLSQARLRQVDEGRNLHIASATAAIGRAQAWSRHRLACEGQRIGCLDLLSVFVGRQDSSNRSVRRVDLRADDAPPSDQAATLLARAKALRMTTTHARPDGDAPTLVVKPCPRSDFNGAGLLYFASFTAMADRALWQWGMLSQRDAVLDRECVFLGNTDPGAELSVALVDHRGDAQARVSTVRIACMSSHRVLAQLRVHVARADDVHGC